MTKISPPFITAKTFSELSTDEFHLRHGFFSRRGGVSSGHFKSLNTGPGSDDAPENVIVNRDLCAQALKGNASTLSPLITLHQIHSSTIVTLDDATIEKNIHLGSLNKRPKADGMVTNIPGILLGILTADCMPFLFADPKARVIGAAHGGWRGTLDGVLENTITAMIALGANPKNIHASLGPCLRQNNFEVGMDLVDAFLNPYPDAEKFFMPGRTPEKRQFDLASFGFWRLRKMGVHQHDDSNICTLANPDEYFSYRHSRQQGAPDYGRNLSAIMM